VALAGWLSAQHLGDDNDLTLEEYRETFEEERGVSISAFTVGRAIACLPGGWPIKKVQGSP
jgi:hypothetical protein